MTTTITPRPALTSKVPLPVICFTLVEIDGHTEDRVARDLGLSLDEVSRLAELERARRLRTGEWKPRVERKRVVVATDPRVCEQHGPYVAQQWALDPPVRPIAGKALPTFAAPFWSLCPTCNGEMELEADRRADEIRDGRTARETLHAAAVRAAGIPARFADATLETWLAPMDAQKTVRGALLDYCANFAIALESGRSLALLGPVGTGKTRAAIGVLLRVLRAGGTGCYTTAADLVGRIRATYQRDAEESEQQVIDAMVAVDLLVVDEIGRQLDTKHEAAQLFRVLDARYREMRPVLLISNLARAEFCAAMGDALVDRLREGGGAILVLDWASHRNRRGAQ